MGSTVVIQARTHSAQSDLKATPEADAMDRSDHWYRDAAPEVGDILRKVRDLTIGTGEQLAHVLVPRERAGRHRSDVQSCTETAPLPVNHDCANCLVVEQLLGSSLDASEHREGEGVELGGPIQRELHQPVRQPAQLHQRRGRGGAAA